MAKLPMGKMGLVLRGTYRVRKRSLGRRTGRSRSIQAKARKVGNVNLVIALKRVWRERNIWMWHILL